MTNSTAQHTFRSWNIQAPKDCTVLVTGGAGYIGSHTVLELIQEGYPVVVVDNLYNAREDCISRVEAYTKSKINFHLADITDEKVMDNIFAMYNHPEKAVSSDPTFRKLPPIQVVIHFAALKAVGESSTIPVAYYKNNVFGTIVLLETMKKYNVKKLIFSSSAVVYGLPAISKDDLITEELETLKTTNPYGRSKKMCEDIMVDLCHAEKGWKVIMLRYFNPVGAHPDSIIGEDPLGMPNNLMPFVARVAAATMRRKKLGADADHQANMTEREKELSKMTHLSVYGNDYDTKDGTGIRDYIHVVDLAKGHVSSLKAVIAQVPKGGPWFEMKAGEKITEGDSICRVYNLGCGKGYSVLDVVDTFSESNQVEVPFKIVGRRAGDVPRLVADPTRARQEIGFECQRGLKEMCQDMWKYQVKVTLGL